MKVRYVFPLDRSMRVEDHWPVPLLGGTCRLVEEEAVVTGVEFAKAGLPTTLSFRIQETPGSGSVGAIHGRDDFLPVVREHIQRAFSYLQCFFNTAISVDEVKVFYEAESDEEQSEIDIPWMHYGKKEPAPLPITYDMMTRAFMAAEEREGPEFVAALATMAREALTRQRYIDCFRFSFLLIEALYGKGKFKSKQLIDAFLASPPLMAAIESAIQEWPENSVSHQSETLTLLNGSPKVEQVVKHLISMRGHYFHGNLDKKGRWHPGKQEEAEALAWLGIGITHKIAADAALPMFADEYAKRHFEEAEIAGAHVVMEIGYKFRVPEDDFIRTRKVNFRMPGTKPTTLMAMEAAFRSVESFREQLPVGRLHSVSGTDTSDGKPLFHIRFFTEPDGTEVKG
jgi:hypothetical protein